MKSLLARLILRLVYAQLLYLIIFLIKYLNMLGIDFYEHIIELFFDDLLFLVEALHLLLHPDLLLLLWQHELDFVLLLSFLLLRPRQAPLRLLLLELLEVSLFPKVLQEFLQFNLDEPLVVLFVLHRVYLHKVVEVDVDDGGPLVHIARGVGVFVYCLELEGVHE